MEEEYKVGSIVTLNISDTASNTFIVDSILGEVVLLSHPLNKDCIIKTTQDKLNKVAAILKDDIERCLDYAKTNSKYLDFNSQGDLDAICLYFVYKRHLTSKQKNTLSNICGIIASIKFDNNIQNAITYIISNEGVLDDFNKMWYNNFQGLIRGSQPITSKKQRASIFNIAGFALAQLETPSTAKGMS